MSISVTRTNWAMAQQIKVGGSVTVPNGAHEIVTVVSGGLNSTTNVSNVTGPITHNLDVEHFAIRQPTAVDANVTVTVRTPAGILVRAPEIDNATINARPAHGDAFIGAGYHPALAWDSALMSRLPGLQVVRFGIAWYTSQPSSSAWDSNELAFFDEVFEELGHLGIKAHVSCGTTPAWARSGGTYLTPPTNPANHGAYVASIVDRWGDNILCVDPWNEPNLDSFWPGTDTQYVQVLAADRAAVDSAMPVCLGPISLNDFNYIDGLFDVGLTGSMFDWVDFHPYPFSFNEGGVKLYHPGGMTPHVALDGSVIGGLHKVEAVLASHGITNKPVVVSEIGVGMNPVDRTEPQTRKTGQEAAELLGECIDLLRRIPHMQAINVHEAKDQSTGPSWYSGFGLLDQNNIRRPVWNMMENLVGPYVPPNIPVEPVVITDSFTRADTLPNGFGSSWSHILNGSQLYQGDIYPHPAGYAYARHLTSIDTADMYVEAEVGNLIYANASAKAIYLFARMSGTETTTTSTWNFYFAYMTYTNASFAGEWGLGYYNNGSIGFFNVNEPLGANLAIGDVLRLEVEGNELRFSRNGVQLIAHTDNVNTPKSGEYAGVGVASETVNYQIALDNFEAGSL